MARVITFRSGESANPLTLQLNLRTALCHPFQTAGLVGVLRSAGKLQGTERHRYMERFAGELAAEGRLTEAQLPDETGRVRRY